MNRKTHNRGQVRKPAQCRPNTRLTAVALALTVTFPVSAATLEWTGTSDTFLATPDNWLTNAIPLADDTLSFAELTNDAYALDNNLTTALHSLVFYGGSYTLTGGDLTLTPDGRDPNILSVYGGSHTIDTAGITLQPLVINRTISQEVFNRYDVNVSGGGVLNLNALINVGSFTPIPGLPYTDNSPPPPAAIRANVATGSTLNLNGAVNNASGSLSIANNGTVTVSKTLNVSTFSLSGSGQTTLRDNGAITWGGPDKLVSLPGTTRLALDNSGTALNGRLGGAAVTMKPTAVLELLGNGTTGVTEHAGKLTINGVGRLNSAESVIRVNANGKSTVLAFSELAFGTSHQGVYDGQGRVDFQTDGNLGSDARIIFTLAPASTDGLLNRATVNGREFAAYDGTLSNGAARGVVAATTRGTLAGALSTDNVFLSGANETMAGPGGVHSLAGNNASLQGGQVLTVGSGQVLLNGDNSIAPALNFAGRQGQINIRSGQTTLQGGLQGSSGAVVTGTGSLILSGMSTLTGTLQVNSPTLILAADNLLQATDIKLKTPYDGFDLGYDPLRATLDIGSTIQTVGSLSGGSVAGTGTLIATGAGITTWGNTSARLQAANGTVTLGGGILSGDINAKNVVLHGVTVTSSVSATSGITANGVLQGNGHLNAPSVSAGYLTLKYATDVGSTASDRISDSAAVALAGGTTDYTGVHIAEQGTSSVRTVEKIGALSISNKVSLNLSGNVGLLADTLTVAPGARLNVRLGDSGTVKFVTSPVAVDGAVVDGVLVDRRVTTPTVTNGVLPVWATYTAQNGLQTEHAIGTLASAGSGVVRVDANQPVMGAISVGAVIFDTPDQITGGGTLTTAKGMAFFQDNTVSIANIQMGSNSLLSNAGTNTIANMSGDNLEKLGEGRIVLSGTSTFNQGELRQSSNNYVFGGGVSVKEGSLVVTGTLNSSVDTAYGAELIVKGSGKVNGNISSVTLEQASFTNKDAWQVGSVSVPTGSFFSNQSGADRIVVLGGTATNGSIDPKVAYAHTREIYVDGGSATNHGYVEHMYVTNGVASNTETGRIFNRVEVGSSGTVTNSGHVEDFDIRAGGQLINATGGTLYTGYHVVNSGKISNAGTFVLYAGDRYSGMGIYEQTAGATTVDGLFEGDMILKGGTLNGWGVITGTVTASGSAKILPGHSPGIMEIENLVLSSGSVLELDVSSTGQADNLTISGLLDAQQGSRIQFNILDTTEASALDINNYVTFSSQPTMDWSNVSFLASTSAGDLYTLSVNADGTVASVTAVPEAETYAMMLAGLGLIGVQVRRQRKIAA